MVEVRVVRGRVWKTVQLIAYSIALLGWHWGDLQAGTRPTDPPSSPGAPATAKFEPAHGQVIVLIGQDNQSVGGTETHRDGYVDHIGIPGGVTHYVYFAEGATNAFGYTFERGSVDGLNSETTWGAGPMCMRCYLESPKLQDTAVHLSISMEFNSEDRVASGEYDHLIDELAAFLAEFSQFPFYIRIGYEFDGSWNDYDPGNFKRAWRRIVDGLRAAGVDNFATVMASSRHHVPRELWDEYWPGDDYVDWLGYSYWHYEPAGNVVLELAREKDKPVMLAEVTPRGMFLNLLQGMVIGDWYKTLFDHVEAHPDVIKALAYINANWDAQPMWRGRGWGDTRVQVNEDVTAWWTEKMARPGYLHGPEGLYQAIGFDPGPE